MNGPDTITEPRRSTLQVPANGQFVWHVNPSSQPRSGQTTPWKLTCRDASGNVLESRDVFVDRGQTINVGLTCGAAAGGGTGGGTTTPTTNTTCADPNGFRSVTVSRRGKGLRLSFRRKVSNKVTVDVFQVSKGRRINKQPIRVKSFKNRTRGFTWAGYDLEEAPAREGHVLRALPDRGREQEGRRPAGRAGAQELALLQARQVHPGEPLPRRHLRRGEGI